MYTYYQYMSKKELNLQKGCIIIIVKQLYKSDAFFTIFTSDINRISSVY